MRYFLAKPMGRTRPVMVTCPSWACKRQTCTAPQTSSPKTPTAAPRRPEERVASPDLEPPGHPRPASRWSDMCCVPRLQLGTQMPAETQERSFLKPEDARTQGRGFLTTQGRPRPGSCRPDVYCVLGPMSPGRMQLASDGPVGHCITAHAVTGRLTTSLIQVGQGFPDRTGASSPGCAAPRTRP